MLSEHTLVDRDGVALRDVVCHRRGRGEDVEQSRAHMLVFVRRGCFLRSADAGEKLLDPTVAYCVNPGEQQRIDHPHEEGDECTALRLDPELVAQLWGAEATLPREPLTTAPAVDLEHRLLLVAGRRGADPHELVERVIALTACVLERVDPHRVAAGRPDTTRRRRALVGAAREALAAEPDRSLPELAQDVAVSSHHLSRVFRLVTGHTISRHRMRLRARAALERLAGGEPDLARLAADLGFADQSHLCRVLRSETGHAPSALREIMGAR